jgi:hypothetical protein
MSMRAPDEHHVQRLSEPDVVHELTMAREQTVILAPSY